MTACSCCATTHDCKRVVLTGGPGAGKTSVLELIKKSFCEHVSVLPEAAGIVFGGGFPRHDDDPSRRCAQRAIYRVQHELEMLTVAATDAAVALCDRGTLDGLAYWPGSETEYFEDLGTTFDRELARYAAVIHLRTPGHDAGYNRTNPLRREDAAEAARIDERIAAAWARHPRRFEVKNSADFLEKARTALRFVREEVPDCCKRHRVEGLDDEAERCPGTA